MGGPSGGRNYFDSENGAVGEGWWWLDLTQMNVIIGVSVCPSPKWRGHCEGFLFNDENFGDGRIAFARDNV